MSNNSEKILKQIIFFGSVLILFLPLFVFRGVMYPYIFSKIILFQIVVEIIFVAWLFLMIYKKEYRLNWRHPLVLTLTIFVGILFLSAVLGVDFQRSFWSTQERMTGVLAIIHFYVFFVVLISSFKEWKDWRRLIWASLICSFLVGLYGFGQRAGLSSFIKDDSPRMSSLLGNPIYLGVYAMLHIFLAGFLFFREKKLFWRIAAIFFVFFNLQILYLTTTRGAILAFLLTAFIFLFFIIFTLPQKRIKKIIIPPFVLLTIIIVSGIIFLQTPQGASLYPKLPSIIQRIPYITGLFSSVDQRTIPWQLGLKGFLEKPITGWGWENFNIPFNKYYFPEILKWGEGSSWFDRSHNQIVDLLTLTGVLGTLAYLTMYGSVFLLIYKKIRRPMQMNAQINVDSKRGQRRLILSLVILGLMFFAYFIQNLTVFDTPAPLIVFYFSLGLAYFMTSTNVQIKENLKFSAQGGSASGGKIQKPKQFPIQILILLIFIFFPWVMYKFNIEPWQQSSLAVRAVQFSQRDLNIGLNLYKEALAKENIFTNLETRVFLAKTMSEQKQENKLFKEGMIFAIAEMEKNTNEHSLDVRHWLNLGQLCNLMGSSDREYLEKGELVLNQAKIISPRRQTIYFELVRTKILKKDFESAIQIAQEAVDLDPGIAEPYKVLAIAYVAAGRIEEGLLFLEKVKESIDIYSDSSLALFLSSTYLKFGDIAKAIEIAEMSVQKWPKNVLMYTHLAALYKEAGEKEKAIETVRKTVELDPSLSQEADVFIETLE